MRSIGHHVIKVARSLPVAQRNRLLTVFKMAKDGPATSAGAKGLVRFFLKEEKAKMVLRDKVSETFDTFVAQMGKRPNAKHASDLFRWNDPSVIQKMVKELLDGSDACDYQILDANFPGIKDFYNGIIAHLFQEHGGDLDADVKVTHMALSLVNNHMTISADILGGELGEGHWPGGHTQAAHIDEEDLAERGEDELGFVKDAIRSIGGDVVHVAMGQHPYDRDKAYFEFEADWEFRTSEVLLGVFGKQELESIAYDDSIMLAMA